MKHGSHKTVATLATPRALLVLALLALAPDAALAAKLTEQEMLSLKAESQVKGLIEPLLERYCRDDCKLISVRSSIDVEVPEDTAPGFDDMESGGGMRLAPSRAIAKILIDERVGPISRAKLLDMLAKFLETLTFPVRIEPVSSSFPQPIGSAGKSVELRDRVGKQFKGTIEDLFRQFCPEHCLLADFELQTDQINPEEAQYGSSGEFVQDSGVALRIRSISATILVDDQLTPEERANVVEMAKLRTNSFKNVTLNSRSMHFPRPIYDSTGRIVGYDGPNGRGNRSLASEKSQATNDSKSLLNQDQRFNQTDTSNRSDKHERYEKIERVENGDAVQDLLKKYGMYALLFWGVLILCVAGIGFLLYRQRTQSDHHFKNSALPGRDSGAPMSAISEEGALTDRAQIVIMRHEIERLRSELLGVFSEQPRVAKQVFSRVLTEEGIEVTAAYIHIFGETVVLDLLRDPSLQSDLSELTEYYAKNPIELKDAETLELLKKLHNRTIAGKMVVMGSQSTAQFDFLTDMDGLQILELIRNESLTVKSIIITQCDSQKRAAIYAQLDEDTRMKLLHELSRIDYLPRDYISNVASALKRKRHENPRLNTEALPGSDVLISLLERSDRSMQLNVLKNLERSNPESARVVKSKLVSLTTLHYLRDGQILEVVLSLKHDELLVFLKGANSEIRDMIIARSPRDLSDELAEELDAMPAISREAYQNTERKIINRIKLMANEGLINLAEANELLLAGGTIVAANPAPAPAAPASTQGPELRRVG